MIQKSTLRVYLTGLYLLLGILFQAQAAPPAGQTWNLVWGDEFEGAEIDSNLWSTGQKPWGTTNNDPCLITPEDSYLENGSLVLRMREGSFSGFDYSCGWAYSKVWHKYGYMEIRAKFPEGKGQWPAWWMLRDGWPPEYDIAEFRGASGPANDYMTQAVYDEAGQWSSKTIGGDYTGWHVYGFEWGPGFLKWYIDGVLTLTVNDPDVTTQPMYTILSAGLDSSADSSTGFPNYFTVDYYRCYQNPPTVIPDAPTDVAITSVSGQVDLSWPAVDSASGYRIKRSGVSGGPYTLIGTTTGLTESRYTDTDVVNFSEYHYVISAVNEIGESADSAEASTMPTPPAISTGQPVTSDSAQGGHPATDANDGDLATRWTASGSGFPRWWRVDLGSVQTIRKVTIDWETSGSVNKYLIETSNDDSSYTTVVDQSGRTTTGNSTEIFTADARYVRITITGSSGGSWGSIYEAQVFGGIPPGAPSSLTASTLSANEISLSWSAGSGATSYAVKRSTSSGGPYTAVGSSGTTSFTDTGLNGNTTYYYVVSSLSDGGASADTSQASDTTLVAPTAPTGLVASGVSTSQVDLAWNAVAGASSYNLKRAGSSGGPYTTVATGIASPSHSDTGLTTGTAYYYVVSAVDANGESLVSGEASATTTPPAPDDLTAAAAYGQVSLSWGAASGATSYNIKRATASGGPYTTVATGITDLSFTDTGLPNDIAYFYVVSAENTSGESADSAFATATPSSAPYIVSEDKPASASSFQGGHEPEDGNDGNGGSRWTASGGSYPQWWKVDLGSVHDLTSAFISWEQSSSRSYQYLIETSNNDVDYTTVVDESGRTATGDSTHNFSASGRYVRVTVTGTSGGWAAFYECQLTGTPGTQGTPPPVPTGLMATGVSDQQIDLSWAASSGATGYNVKRSSEDGGPYTAVSSGVAGTSFSNTGLAAGTTYYYIVTAINASSESADSSQASAITAPGAPTGLTAFEGDAEAVLDWTAVEGATSYNVRSATSSGGSYTTIATGITGVSYTDTGLTNGTTYYYVVSAENTAGEGANSNEVSVTPLALLSLGQPATASSTEGGRSPADGNDDNLSTRWTASGGGYPQWWKVDLGAVQTINKAVIIWESGDTRSYKYQIDISDDDATYTTLVDQTARTETGDSTDIFSATARYVRITITGTSGGWAAFYECNIYGIEGFQPTPPNAPTGLMATAISSSQIDLSWTASSGATSYNLKRATSSGGSYSTIATGVTSLSYSDTTANSGTTYYYVVSAVNGVGEGTDSNEAEATTVPSAPTGLTSTAGNTQAIIDWAASTGADSYTVKRATVNGGPYTSIASGITTLSYIDTGLANGTIYYYVVSAENAAGESADSAEVSVTPDLVPTLISQGQPVTVSSSEGGNGPENGNDGDPGTRWAASNGSYPQWWKVDLGSIQSINEVNISWFGGTGRSYKYQISVSDDDVSYTMVVDESARTATGDSSDTMTESGRYVLVTVTGSSAGWAGLYEVEVLGGLPGANVTPESMDFTIVIDGTDSDLSWESEVGWSYRLWTSTTLESWQEVTTVPGTGNRMEYSHTNQANEPKRFWQVEATIGDF